MLAAVYRYGAPPSIDALSALLEKEAEEKNLSEYLALVGWSIGKYLYRDHFIPSYADMSKKVTDNRSGAQIVDDLAEKLRKRKEKREKAGVEI